MIYISGNPSSLIMRVLKEKCLGFVFNRGNYFSPNSLNMLFKKNKFKKIYQKSSNFLDYNESYHKPTKNSMAKSFSKELEELILKNLMGYKFLTIFKK